MKKLTNKFLFLFLIFPLLGYTQDTIVSIQRLDALEMRIKDLEAHKESLEKMYELKTQELKNFNDEQLSETKKQYSIITYWGLPGTVLALMAIIYGGWRFVNNKIKKEVTAIAENKREIILDVVRSEETEAKIRWKKKILVLSNTTDESKSIKEFFIKTNFDPINIKYREATTFQDHEKFDLVVFNDLPVTLVQEYLAKSRIDSLFVGYTITGKRYPNNDKLNYANSKFTLYARIIETLKFQEILKLR